MIGEPAGERGPGPEAPHPDAVAHLAPLSVGGHKAALNIADPLDLTEADMVTLKALETRAFASDDLREGLTAFVEKRRPEFHGR